MDINSNKDFFNIMLSKQHPYTIHINHVKARGLKNWVKFMRLKTWWDSDIELTFVKWFLKFSKK